MRNRRPFRSHARRTTRRVCHSTVRARWRSPDDLLAALVAYDRAVRSHRRLARLAPHSFDFARVQREHHEREERRQRMVEVESALAKVYGTHPQPCDPVADLPPLPSLRTRRVIEWELAALELWLNVGKLAFARHQQRRPHPVQNLGRIVRMCRVAICLGQLAAGVDPNPHSTQPDRSDTFLDDLNQVYGHQPSPAPATAGSLPAASESFSSSDVVAAPSCPLLSAPPIQPSNHPSTQPSCHPPPAPVVAPSSVTPPIQSVPRRCDAWSRWARYVNQRNAATR